MPNAVLLNDTCSWYHWGCTATSQALRLRIQRFGYQLISIPIQTVYELEHLPQKFGDFDNVEFFQSYYKAYPSVINALSSAEVVVINGEGTMHRVTRPALSLLYLAYISKKFLGKSVQMINHSVYPDVVKTIQPSAAFDIYQGVYRALDYIAIREPISHRLMLQCGLPAVRSFDSLPLIVKEFYQPRDRESAKPSVVVAGSVSFPVDRIPDLCRLMESLIGRGYDVNVLIGAKDNPAKDDLAFVEHLRTYSGERIGWNLIEARSLQEWFDTFHRASLLISGRFHHTIAASCMGVPTVICESNTLKNQALSEMLELDPPIDYKHPDFFAMLTERVERGLNEPRRDVTARLDEWCALAEKNFDGLRRLAGRQSVPAPVEAALR